MYSNNEPYLLLLVPESVEKPQLQLNFQLRPDEAIVLIGLTPPTAKYFSFSPYVWTRVSPDGTRHQLAASLGDAVNNATVKTIGPTPFNAPVALIFTPDQGTDARVRAALQRAGYPAAIINTVVFPASMLNLGHRETADELRAGVRTAIWQDSAAGDAYVNNPPLKVFRVTPHPTATANPFPAPPLRIRGTGQTEMDLMNKLGQLRQGIIDANPGLNVIDIPSKPSSYEGYDFIQRGVDPWGDSRDALYITAGWVPEVGSNDKVTLANDEFLMVYGPNHVATGKATYMSINVYASEDGMLTLGNVDDRKITGTAMPYLPAGDPATDRMYAYKVSRNCGSEPNCLALSTDNCERVTIDSNTIRVLWIRTYLEPATKIGPAMPEILYDRVIKLSPQSP
jgi:hypothetical protein